MASSRYLWNPLLDKSLLPDGLPLSVGAGACLRPPGRGPTDALPGSGTLLVALTIALILLFMAGVAWWWRAAFVAALERSLAGTGPIYKPGLAGQNGAGRPAQKAQGASPVVSDKKGTKMKRRR